MSLDLTAATRKLAGGFRTGAPIADLAEEERPKTRSDAFAVQDAVFEALGFKVGAWKVGGSPNTEPTSAPIPAHAVFASPAVLPSKKHRNFGIEAEIAFRLGADMPPQDTVYTAEDVIEALDAMMVTIEVVESRFSAWPKIDPLWNLADFQANGTLIVGEPVPIPSNLDFSGQRVRLAIDDVLRVDAVGTFAGGDPFLLIAWLASHLSSHQGFLGERGLKKGDVVTTGSWNPIEPARPGAHVLVEFPGVGSVDLRFD